VAVEVEFFGTSSYGAAKGHEEEEDVSQNAFIVIVEPLRVDSDGRLDDPVLYDDAARNVEYIEEKFASGELLLSARTEEPPFLAVSIIVSQDEEEARRFALEAPSVKAGIARVARIQRASVSIRDELPAAESLQVDKFVKTPRPAWDEEANYILHGVGPYGDKVVREQLWAKSLGEGRFELRCLPLYLYGFAFGDVITVDAKEHLDVVCPSGRASFRVVFPAPPAEGTFEREVEVRRGRVVWYTCDFAAVDAKKDEAAVLERWLEEQHLAGLLEWEAANR